MKKLIRTLIAAALAAVISLGAGVTAYAEAPEEPQMTREEEFMDRVQTALHSMYPRPKQLRVTQPFRIYNADGTLSDLYHYFVFDGDKMISNLELVERDGKLHLASEGGRAYEEVEKAYADGTEIALVMRKDRAAYMTTKDSRVYLGYPPKTEKKAAPKFAKLEKIQLTDVNIPDDFYDKKWEEELIYYSKYRRHKDEDFYEGFVAKAGGPAEWWLSWEDADLFRNAEKQVIQFKYEDFEEGGYRQSTIKNAAVKINLYLSCKDCYTYIIDLNERHFASIPEIIKETGLLESGKYKDIIGVIIESPADWGNEAGRFMTGYDFSPKGWMISGNSVYYVKKDLTLAKGSYLVKGTRYGFDENGVWQGLYTGWTKANGKSKYWKNGLLMQSRLFDADGKRWVADENGYASPYTV